MTVDVKVYALAKIWLQHTGWHNDRDIARLAEAIQSCIQDFQADLENDLIREQEHHGL
jgi:hypothetical protein